jgi:hypothetical protein
MTSRCAVKVCGLVHSYMYLICMGRSLNLHSTIYAGNIDRVDCISVQTTSHPFYLFTQEFVWLLSHDICNLQSNFRHTAMKNYITMLSVLLTCYRTPYALVSCSRNLLLCAQFSAILLHVHAPQIGTVKETRYLIVFSMSEVGDLSSFFLIA